MKSETLSSKILIASSSSRVIICSSLRQSISAPETSSHTEHIGDDPRISKMDAASQKPAMTPETRDFLQQLRRQYLALYPIRHIDFHPSSGSSIGAEPLYKHQDWIHEHLLSWKFQPAKDYQRKFLKGLIDAVEEGLRSEEAVLEEWVSAPYLRRLEVLPWLNF